MAAETKNGARGGAAAARSRAASLTRAQLAQKAKGQPAMLANLRIVMSATVVTIVVLMIAFGGIGFLLLARSPQEPIVSKLDLSPLVPPTKLEPASQVNTKTISIPAPVVEAPQVKTDETVAAPLQKKDETVLAPQNPVPVPAPEPETTATIPPPPPQAEPKPQITQQIIVKQRAPQRPPRVVRRAPQKKAEPQFVNPFSQLFGGTK